MAVVTISREHGSEGINVGRKVAEMLGYRFAEKRIIERVLQQYGFVQYDDLLQSTPGFWARFDQTNQLLIQTLNNCLAALARQGNIVIAGRGGFAVLGAYADVLNVRIQAPFDVRVQRIMVRDAVTEQVADERVRSSDRARAAFFQTFYGVQPDAAGAFDLVVDTGAIPPEMAAEWIVAAVRMLEAHEDDTALTTRQIEVEPILANTVAEVLESEGR